ncbi:MAG: EpsI family protein [Desulfarculus sp.]|jgi:EpsI family protein|nr:MAG: EpsI family protein [Desulfarculus sp.]
MKKRSTILALLIACGLLALAALFITLGQDVTPRKLRQPIKDLPLALGPWRGVGPDSPLDRPTLELLRPSDYLLRNYADPQGLIAAVFIAFFELQQEGQIIHSPRHCLPGSGWQISSRKAIQVPGPKGPYRVNQLILSKDLDKLSVLYWYQGRGRVEANEYYDRLCLILDGLFKDRSDGALVRITSVLPGGDSRVVEQQVNLAARIIPALNKLMPPQ